MNSLDLQNPVSHEAAVSHAQAKDARRYCYHCRKHHEGVAMRRIVFKNGVRWRCHASILAANQARQEREVFGRQTSAANRADGQRRIAFVNEVRRLRDC